MAKPKKVKKKYTGVRLPDPDREWLDHESARSGRSITELVREAVKNLRLEYQLKEKRLASGGRR